MTKAPLWKLLSTLTCWSPTESHVNVQICLGTTHVEYLVDHHSTLNFGFILLSLSIAPWTSLVAQTVKCLSTMWETQVRSLGREDPLEEEMATHSSILAWRIRWIEEPGGLQSIGSH